MLHRNTRSVSSGWSLPVLYIPRAARCGVNNVYKRLITIDGRQRLSGHWAPSARGTNADPKTDDAHTLLVKAGFLQQAYSGVYQMLPLGLRVQEKIERLVEKQMRSVGASKLSLSALSSEALWQESGRLQGDSSELLRLRSRAKDAFLLSPTHEEEITKLVARNVKSAKDLPLRLYQISRKYRDELRPRSGLLRAREFLMKDLYTFDVTEEAALATYAEVKQAYHRFFAELALPYLVAEADSGSMGGNRSHEFHFPSPMGEDTVWSCDSCSYVANEELAEAYRPIELSNTTSSSVERELQAWYGLRRGGRELLVVLYEDAADAVVLDGINTHAIRKLVPDLDTGVEESFTKFLESFELRASVQDKDSDDSNTQMKITIVHDVSNATPIEMLIDSIHAYTTPNLPAEPSTTNSAKPHLPHHLTAQLHRLQSIISQHPSRQPATVQPTLRVQHIHPTHSLTRIKDGSYCPRCRTGMLSSERAIELGHTFHLGTRYSQPLGAVIPLNSITGASITGTPTPIQMGCHGIGLTRLLSASASALADERGLKWPVKIAPFAVMVLASPSTPAGDVEVVYDILRGNFSHLSDHRDGKPCLDPDVYVSAVSDVDIDAAIDDRPGSSHSLVQKLRDADLAGYPVLVVLGRQWATTSASEEHGGIGTVEQESRRVVEVQCRQLGGLKSDVELWQLARVVKGLLVRLGTPNYGFGPPVPLCRSGG